MKPLLVCLLVLLPCALVAQSQQPFVFTAYGGLFFPSNPDFKDAYRSSSDLLYGGGIGLPLSPTLFLTGDYSWFKPEALLYRRSRGLQDYDERMAVLIQEVQGQKWRQYYLPFGAGVAFSRNIYRWAPQIRREDGFVRLVWGLGTLHCLTQQEPTV